MFTMEEMKTGASSRVSGYSYCAHGLYVAVEKAQGAIAPPLVEEATDYRSKTPAVAVNVGPRELQSTHFAADPLEHVAGGGKTRGA